MKKILGLDLGTNSIGWAVVEIDDEKRIVRIIALGSRILPMDAGEISTFENGGKLKSSASDRTELKSKRKNIYRFLLRRDRLHCVLNLLGILPEHYKLDIEFTNNKGKRSGKIRSGKEPKLAYYIDEKGKKQFLFMDSYNEMEKEFKSLHPNMFYKKKNGKETKLPYDWTLYYLRKKALSQALTDEELAWVIMSFLQKRGYEKVMGLDEKEQKEGELSETLNTKVVSIEELKSLSKNDLKQYKIKLADFYGNIVFEYIEEASYQISQIDEFKQIEKLSKLDEDGNIKSTSISICEVKKLGIEDITKERNKDKIKFIIKLSSGWNYEYTSKYEPKQNGEPKDFIIKSTYDTKGNFKNRTIKMPQKEDWELIKLRTEKNILDHNTKNSTINNTISVASYIYDALLKDPSTKIKAGLVNTIERKYYEDELKAILDSQKRFHPYLKDEQKYKEAITLLYPNNETHRNSLYNKQDFNALLGDDIIFYQRDLKSKKSLIANCRYESRTYTTKDGETITTPLKCIPKSNPYYQEFRLWQFIKRLKIIQLEAKNDKGEDIINQDVTTEKLNISQKESLFAFINNRKEVSQNVVLKALGLDAKAYKWNFEEDHIEPCNETRYDFILRLKRIKNFEWEKFLNAKSKVHMPDGQKNHNDTLIDGCTNEYLLWHFFYSVKKKNERIVGLPKLIEKVLNNAGLDLSWKNKVVEMLSSFSTYKNEYGTYSEKAIKKLLPFMRLGKYWNQEDVEKAKTAEEIKPEVLTKEYINGKTTDLQGLWVSSACYLVYGRYSEVDDIKRWTQPNDIKEYLKNLKHNSFNNPVVEKVIRETLMVVHDIWTTYGEVDVIDYDKNGKEYKTYKKFFDKINVEIGTSLKKNNKAKESDSKKNEANRLANERARVLLKELKATYHDKWIKEYSPYQQDKIKILETDIINSIKYDKDDKEYEWEDGVETTEKEFTKKEINEFLKKEVSEITQKDIKRYRLWLDKRYLSPYTGEPISLSKLLNREEYEIEHIFPQERVTLNAMCNKVICETKVNKLKRNRTGYEFILDYEESNGKTSYNGETIELLTPEKYVENVKKNIKDKDKQEILLSKDIPDRFGNSQMNNMRYITKLAMGLMSNIVREDDEKEFKSKNVLVISGGVTTTLKRDWQLDDAWNEIIKPRFLHLNELLNTDIFGTYRIIDGHRVFVPSIPQQGINAEEENEENSLKDIKVNSDINKKRIDHRHHALDALIIALSTNNHVNYINNVSALDVNSERKDERKDLKAKYMITKKHEDETKEQYFLPPMQYKENGNIVPYLYVYKQSEPQQIFKYAAIEALQHTLVTFKQKNRLMRQRINWIRTPDPKENKKQSNLNIKKNYSVRQSLHKDTFYGKRKFKPVPIESAINRPDSIVENKVKNAILQYMQEGKNIDKIIEEIKKIHEVVYVYEDCATTQRNHSLEYFANIKEKDNEKNKKVCKSAIIQEIECIADITIQNILKKHLYKYDSIQIPVSEAVNYYNDIVDVTEKVLVDKYKVTGNGGEKKVDVYIRNKKIDNRENIKHNPQVAFSSDGIKDLNQNIVILNNGKLHKPIYKVQITQAFGKMFAVSQKDDENINKIETIKDKQFVISDAGSNNFCGVYKSEEGKTKVYVPSLKNTIKSIRKNEILIPEIYPDDASFKYSFTLSPLDMVYMPTDDEIINGCNCKYIDYERIFVVNDFNEQGKIYFRKYNFAKEIIQHEMDLQKEKNKIIGSRDFKTAKHEGKIIRDYCVPIKVDRLGNIIEIDGKPIK